jgi:hypothetical protein
MISNDTPLDNNLLAISRFFLLTLNDTLTYAFQARRVFEGVEPGLPDAQKLARKFLLCDSRASSILIKTREWRSFYFGIRGSETLVERNH